MGLTPVAGLRREPDAAAGGPSRMPITASHLVPPPLSHPKPWHRVPVPPAHGRHDQRRIWKRVGGIPRLARGDGPALAELAAQGQGARKRARTAALVLSLAKARWEAPARGPRDGSWDLVEARVSVGAARDEQARAADAGAAQSRPATFPEENLRWVPRKRHNSRWPIEPAKAGAPAIADMQPLIAFDVPTADAGVDVAQPEPAPEKPDTARQARRKSRRLSRRLSLAPVQEADEHDGHDEQAASLPPAQTTDANASPLRKPPMKAASPTKVSMSPSKSFTVTATPTKVIILDLARQFDSPATSPTKAAALAPIVEERPSTPRPDLDELLAGTPCLADVPPPLLFDQPCPDEAAEPEYELKRRASLHNARRAELRCTRIARLLAFETPEPPSRRHSFGPTERSGAAGGLMRRHTLNVFQSGTEQAKPEGTGPDDGARKTTEPARPAEPDVPTGPLECAVEVDVRMNLDIFGQSPPVARGSPPMSLSRAETRSLDRRLEHSPKPPPSPSGVPGTFSERLQDGDTPNALGICHGAGYSEGPMNQAAALASPPDTPPAMSPGSEFTPPAAAAAPDGEAKSAAAAEPRPTASSPPASQPPPTASDPAAPRTDETGRADGPLPEANVSDRPGSSPAHASTSADVLEAAGLLGREEESPEPAFDDEDDDLSSGGDESMSDLAPDDVSTAIRVEFYQPTVAIDMDGGEDCDGEEGSEAPTGDDYPLGGCQVPCQSDDEDTVGGGAHLDGHGAPEDESLVVTLKFDPASEAAASILSTPSPASDMAPARERTELPGTPLGAGAQSMAGPRSPRQEIAPGGLPEDSPGFKPINGHQRSSSSPSPADEEASQAAEKATGPVDGARPVLGSDDVTRTAELEVGTTEEARRQSSDSDTDMLRDFITRVREGKHAKAAAAAAASRLRPKRRSGSTGSATASGSPLAKTEARAAASTERLPLGEKDLNMSPSPTKKRKLKTPEDLSAKENARLGKPALDDMSPPQPKRRRKHMEAETGSVLSADFQDGQSLTETAGVRRSTRNRQTRAPLRATAAASTALSLIPVRLPGSSGVMQDGDPMATFTLSARTRSAEKDLAAVTRVNTRKNKANAVPPQAVLAMQAEDPGWRMRELKSVFDAREAHAAPEAAEGDEGSSARAPKKNRKGVRWADKLVRFQGDEEPSARAKTGARVSPGKGEADATGKGLPELEEIVPPKLESVEGKPPPAEPEAAEQEEPEKKAPARRTRASKLQPPKTRSSIATAAPAQPPAPATPAATPAAKKPAAAPKTTGASVVRMATRRTKLATLGMSGNGTPAPKRRAARTVS